jgi:uncharacterized protein
MNSIRCVICLIAALTFSSLSAVAASSESIERLLQLTKVQKMFVVYGEQLDGFLKTTLKQAFAENQMGEVTDEFVNVYASKIAQELRKEMSWDKMKGQYIQLYSEIFTQEEIDAQLAFYDSPAGRSIVEKIPVLTQKSMALGQQTMAPMMQRLQQLVAESLEEAKKSSASSK